MLVNVMICKYCLLSHQMIETTDVRIVDNMFVEGQSPELGNMSVNFQTLSDENIFMVILFGINYK